MMQCKSHSNYLSWWKKNHQAGKKCCCYNSHQIIPLGVRRCFHFIMGATLISVDYFAVEWKSRLVWKIFSKGYPKNQKTTPTSKKKKNPFHPRMVFVLFCTWLSYICVCLDLEPFSSSPLFFFLFTLLLNFLKGRMLGHLLHELSHHWCCGHQSAEDLFNVIDGWAL